jgi:hypothetical protein
MSPWIVIDCPLYQLEQLLIGPLIQEDDGILRNVIAIVNKVGLRKAMTKNPRTVE